MIETSTEDPNNGMLEFSIEREKWIDIFKESSWNIIKDREK